MPPVPRRARVTRLLSLATLASTFACQGGASTVALSGSGSSSGQEGASTGSSDAPTSSGASAGALVAGAGGSSGGTREAGPVDAGALVGVGDVVDGSVEAAVEEGSVDDAGVDAPDVTAAGGSSCAGVFCEDFEEGQLDPAKWSVETMGGATAVVEQENVAHGKYAAQFHGLAAPAGGATSAYAYFITKNAPPALRVHNFGRAYFYIAPKPRSVDLGLVFGGTDGFPKPTYLSIASHNGGWQFGFIKLQGSPEGESQAYPPGDMPVMTWTCLEWEFNDQPDRIDVWGNGALIGSLDAEDVAYPPNQAPGTLFDNMTSGLVGGFADFGFGFYDWHPGGFPFDVYYDDIVLDTKRVGCL